MSEIYKKRTIPGAEQKLYEDLRWAGLRWDEGGHSFVHLVTGARNANSQQGLLSEVRTGPIDRYALDYIY